MAARESLAPTLGAGDKLDGEGTAPELVVKIFSVRPQVMGSCAGVDPELSENQEHRALEACYEARQADDESNRLFLGRPYLR